MNCANRTSLLRQVISAIFLATAVLLAAVEIRSYWWRDSVVAGLSNESSVTIQSSAGQMLLGIFPEPRDWHVDSQQRSLQSDKNSTTTGRDVQQIGDSVFPLGTIVILPHWYLVLVLGTFAVVPRIRWQFGLRTLAGGLAIAALTLASVILAY
jgi:hypothetical protein